MSEREIVTEQTPSGWVLRHTLKDGFRWVQVFGPGGVSVTAYGWAEADEALIDDLDGAA